MFDDKKTTLLLFLIVGDVDAITYGKSFLVAAADNADSTGDITDGDGGPILAGLKAAFDYAP